MEVKIFISYSHLDKDIECQLLSHLKNLKRLIDFTIWSDADIYAGDDFEKRIFSELDSSQIILLLVSANFINSDYSYEKEMKYAMELHDKSRAIVIPVMLSPCNCDGMPFYALQTTPDNPKTIKEWPDTDRACMKVVSDIEIKINKSLAQLSNLDIDLRKKEVEEMVSEGSFTDALKRLLDFCTDFSKPDLFEARSYIGAFNSLVRENKDSFDQRIKLAGAIYGLLNKIRPLKFAA